ncbi:MAG: ABC transporter permease [Thermomicrobiales bacterium]|nr:ABC transporter permease [Thermomicrobiales bacterium]
MTSGIRPMFARELTVFTNDRINFLLSIVPNLLYLLLFSTSMRAVVGLVEFGGQSVDYFDFVMPGIIASTLLSAGTTSANTINQERMNRLLLEIWSYPITRRDYVIGKTGFSVAMVVGQCLVMLIMGQILSPTTWQLWQWASILAAIACISVASTGLYLLAATYLRDPQRFMIVINIAAPVLLFSSPSFYSFESMPKVLQWISVINPLSWMVITIRACFLTGFRSGAVGVALLLVLGIVAVIAASWRLSREDV